MPKQFIKHAVLFLTLGVFITFSSHSVIAEEQALPSETITIENAYAFATLPGSQTGAAFMHIKNTGTDADYLISVDSDVAEINEIHENLIDPDDGKMMMRKIKSIAIPANGGTILQPTGKHIMLIKLPKPLTLDSSFLLTLNFEKSGRKTIDVQVVQPGTTPENKEVPKKMMEHDHSHMHHSKIEKPETKTPKKIVEKIQNTAPKAGTEKFEDAAGEEYQRPDNSIDEVTNY